MTRATCRAGREARRRASCPVCGCWWALCSSRRTCVVLTGVGPLLPGIETRRAGLRGLDPAVPVHRPRGGDVCRAGAYPLAFPLGLAGQLVHGAAVPRLLHHDRLVAQHCSRSRSRRDRRRVAAVLLPDRRSHLQQCTSRPCPQMDGSTTPGGDLGDRRGGFRAARCSRP